MDIHYWAVIVGCGVLAMAVGFVWYGPFFGRVWMRITNATEMDLAKRKEMQKKVAMLYVLQFALTLFQLFVLSHLTGYSAITGMKSALWAWGGFVLPVIAGTCMWNNDTKEVAWARFLIQGGYQLICFVLFGIILGAWL